MRAAAVLALGAALGLLAACTSAEPPLTPATESIDSRTMPSPPTLTVYPSEAEASATGVPVNYTAVPLQALQEAIRTCLANVSADDLSAAAPGIESRLSGIAQARPGFSAQAIGIGGALPVLWIDVANPQCMFDEFIAWRSEGQWRLQYLNRLFPQGGAGYNDYRIAPLTLRGEQTPPRQVAKPQGIRLGVITRVANCGDAPHASLLLLGLDGDSWRIVWDARHSEIAELAHTQVQFVGEGIDNIHVTGTSWFLHDPQRNIFLESNPGPHRYFEEAWTLDGDKYVLAEKHVRPSVYNTLVQFVYRLSTGDEAGAATLVADEALVETARSLGLVQDPLGQEWLISLERNTECCGPIRILQGSAAGVTVWFVQQGENWLISDIQPGGDSEAR
jgi:hypothetical protein